MYSFLKEDLKTIIKIFLIIIVTHALFFMAYSYCMSGDAFLALRNFYEIMYNVKL
ncbi:hypothetical protein [Methanobrevibacter sp.]|uniref:hypothetical protein n=1 Tax=Methanobrevibacter sp. TaxID=66852 RepID=UPI00386EE6CA